MKRYVVEGPAIAKLLQENRIRVQRGDLTFTPLAGDGEEADTKAPVVADNKDVEPKADAKKPVRKARK